MKKTAIMMVLLIAFSTTLLGDYSDGETYNKTLKFPNPTADNYFSVDNINGWIEVTGYDGDEIIIEVKKAIKADSKSDLETGMKEAKLGVEIDGRYIRIFDDGPWRNKNYDWDDLDYEPTFYFIVKVPENTNIELETVNGDYIKVSGVKGNFNLSNVNGKIEMTGAEGYGKAKTVNGEVSVAFNKSPKDDCQFKTINGDVTAAFPEDANGEFSCKTLNGDVYTDFEVSYSTSHDVSKGHKGGRYRYESDNSLRLKIGDGGPQFKMSTINGDISIPLNN